MSDHPYLQTPEDILRALVHLPESYNMDICAQDTFELLKTRSAEILKEGVETK